MKKKILSLILALTMVFGTLLPIADFADTLVMADAASCPISGATGTGTEDDPVIVDSVDELRDALKYDGKLHIELREFSASRIYFLPDVTGSFVDISSEKILNLKTSLEFIQPNTAQKYKFPIFRVLNGGHLTIFTEGSFKSIKHTYTVVEAYQSDAKVTLKGNVRLMTTTKDETDMYSYALRCYTGSTFIDGAELSSAQFTNNNVATIKNVDIKGHICFRNRPITLYPGSLGYYGDKNYAVRVSPFFGESYTYREGFKVSCLAGFNEQSPAMPEGSTTAPTDKAFLGLDKIYEFSTANNPTWARKEVYTPTGEMQIVDTSNGSRIYSKKDSDSGTYDQNVDLKVNLKNEIDEPGTYEVREILTLTRQGVEMNELIHKFPVEVVDFREFINQSPKMPAGKVLTGLGKITTASYPITFQSHSLPKSMIDEGYTSTAKLLIYEAENDKYVYGEKAYCTNGAQKINYDLNNLPAGSYYFIETVELRDKNNKLVQSAENIFTIDWQPVGAIQTINISATWNGKVTAPVSKTEGVVVKGYKWQRYTGSTWVNLTTSDTLYEGNTYRLGVAIEAAPGYELAPLYTVKIDGFAAQRQYGNDWYVQRSLVTAVSDVYVYEIARPEVGAYPDFTGDPQSPKTEFDNAKWFPCDVNGKKTGDALTADDKFEEGYYRLEVTVKPPKGKNVVFEQTWINVSTYDFRLLDINGDFSDGWFYPDPEDHSVFTMWIVYHTDDSEGLNKLTLDGVTMKDGDYLALNATSVTSSKPSGAYAYYKDGVLTLNNYKDEKAPLVFKERHLEINLVGTNELYSIHDENRGEGTDPYCLTIGGSGSLKMTDTAPSYIFALKGDLNFTGGKITFEDGGYCGTYGVKRITIDGGADVKFNAYSFGLTYGQLEELAVKKGSFSAFDGGSWEGNWINNNIDISEGSVHVYAHDAELNPDNPGLAQPQITDAHPWDGVTLIGKYDWAWIISDDICAHELAIFEKAPATCESEGFRETFGVCEKCALYVKKADGTILTGNNALNFLNNVVIPKTAHDFTEYTKKTASCTAEGYKESFKICKNCNEVHKDGGNLTGKEAADFFKDVVIPKTEHQYEWVVTKPAEEGVAGEKSYKCKVCGNVSKTEPIPALEPDYILGDVNGDGKVTAADARLALRYSVGLETFTERMKKAAEVDGKPENITAADARIILRASVGLEKLN